MLAPEDEDALRFESYRELARTTPATVPVYPAMVAGCALASSFAEEHFWATLLLVSATALAGLARLWLARQLLRQVNCIHAFRLSALLVGLSWGLFNAFSVYWYGTGWASQLAMVVTVGLTAGATSTLASDLALFRVYTVVMLLPGSLLLAGLEGKNALSSLPLFIFMIFIGATGRQHHHRYWKSIRSEHLLKRRTAELEEANQAKSQFLATMSHEIRTPMNAVMGMTELLMDSQLEPVQQEWVSALRGGSQTLLSIITGILDLSKIESGQLELERQPYDLAAGLRETVALFSVAARQKGLELRTHWQDGPVWLLGDSLRVRQILSNLVSNALKFTQHGHIAVELHWPAPDQAELRICDSGEGVAPEKLDRLFKPFSQADASISRRYGGTGLGLAICHQLAGLLGGAIWMESRSGVAGQAPPGWTRGASGSGSCFYFRWPVERVQAPATEALQHQPLPAGLRILVAEDNAVNRRVIATMLEKLGYAATLVEDGSQAVEACSSGSFQVVFMDLQMPVLDGVSATRRIRSAELPAQPWVIALTANAFREDREASLAAGMDDFLSKPVRQVDVEQALRRFAGTGTSPADAGRRS
ncbi:MAG: response regulator [Candidatus Eremiobacteraeota bacterium]|nr:response regulator [Candidatus Eremiobacteraeota bacterium]MCW5871552.1 response regulator [Candidatus Eremiobacteraeota bacterium]